VPAGTPQIVGVSPGEPFDRRTWSGASHHLFRALDDKHALAGVVSAAAPDSVDLAAKALAFWPERERWRERYELSPLLRAVTSRVASRRINRLAAGPAALLQIGAWYDPGTRMHPPPLLRCSYHDANLPLVIREAAWPKDPTARHVRRVLDREQRLADRRDLIFTMSDWLRESFIEDFGQQPGKVVTVGAGANAPELPRAIPGRSYDSPRFLFVGFTFELKGGEELLHAFRTVRAELPAAELWIVGPEPGDPAPGVRWWGKVDRRTPAGDAEMKRLHTDATAFVLPSRYDSFPNVFLEAMAYGLPCIGSNAGGIPEMVDHGHTGLIVPRRDADRLAGAMLELAADPARARAMGEAGFRRIHERFTWDRVADRMLDAIGERTGGLPAT
jgi:glycosyltransferase involved in cell wall biosynthesis